jgi:hypothetical protein
MSHPFLVFERADDQLLVDRDDEGRGAFLLFGAYDTKAGGDGFHIGIGWDSLARLLDRSSRQVFSWEMKDKSLLIEGRMGAWTLGFRQQGPPYGTITLPLDAATSARLREALAALVPEGH